MSARRASRWLLGAALGALGLYLALGAKPWHVPGGPGFFAHPEDALLDVVKRALWWSAAGCAALCTLLLATTAAWTAPVAPRGPAAPGLPRWLAPLLVAAVLLGAGLRFTLATGSLWWDEAWLVRRIAVGEFRPPATLDAPHGPFRPAPWVVTLFDYRKPTNHLPQSAASRLSVELWRAATGAPAQAFDELALRLPTLAAALVTIVLVGLLAADWGHPRAGVAAAFLLALQPWHIETATGARGFAFVGLAAAATALALGRALRGGRWAAWLGYAAGQTLLLWTHPFAVYLAACLAGAAGLTLAVRARWRELGRLVAMNVLAGAALLGVMGPAIAQAPLWQQVHKARADDRRSPVTLARKTAAEVWSNAAVGLTRQLPQTDPERRYPSLRSLRAREPLLRPTVDFVLPALLGIGALAAWRRAGAARPVVVGLVLAPALALVASAALGHLGRRFHARYFFFVVAFVPPLLAIGLETIGSLLGGARRRAAAGALALAAGVALLAWLQRPALANLATHPYAGMRAAVAFVGGAPDAARALRAGFGLGGDTARVYDPTLLHAESAEDLRRLCARARADGRPLYLLYGYLGQNDRRHPDAFALLDDPRLFEPVGRFDAVAPEFVYRVLRYTGAPVVE
jgi:hypothetical protein